MWNWFKVYFWNIRGIDAIRLLKIDFSDIMGFSRELPFHFLKMPTELRQYYIMSKRIESLFKILNKYHSAKCRLVKRCLHFQD